MRRKIEIIVKKKYIITFFFRINQIKRIEIYINRKSASESARAHTSRIPISERATELVRTIPRTKHTHTHTSAEREKKI